MLATDGVLEPGVFFLRKAVILRKLLRSPECLFGSVFTTLVGSSRPEIMLDDLFDKLVLGRLSLELHEVGAVDWDMIEPWRSSKSMVVADGEEAVAWVIGEVQTGDNPRSRASRCSLSSTSVSVVAG